MFAVVQTAGQKYREKPSVKYQGVSLLPDDIVVGTNVSLSRDEFLTRMDRFRKNHTVNATPVVHPILPSSDLITVRHAIPQVKLPWNVVEQIIQYLSLNDIVNVFSVDAFP